MGVEMTDQQNAKLWGRLEALETMFDIAVTAFSEHCGTTVPLRRIVQRAEMDAEKASNSPHFSTDFRQEITTTIGRMCGRMGITIEGRDG
jgi:hypothetical protein